MRLSTKGRYGARFMLDLALHYGQGPIPLRDVAERQGISEKYLERLFAALRRAGLVSSTRGPLGGYTLTRLPEEVRLKEILEAVEECFTPVKCVEDPDYCAKKSHCTLSLFWSEFRDNIPEFLDSYTLRDLIDIGGNIR